MILFYIRSKRFINLFTRSFFSSLIQLLLNTPFKLFKLHHFFISNGLLDLIKTIQLDISASRLKFFIITTFELKVVSLGTCSLTYDQTYATRQDATQGIIKGRTSTNSDV